MSTSRLREIQALKNDIADMCLLIGVTKDDDRKQEREQLLAEAVKEYHQKVLQLGLSQGTLTVREMMNAELSEELLDCTVQLTSPE